VDREFLDASAGTYTHVIQRIHPDAESVHVVHGRAPDIDADRAAVDAALGLATDTDTPVFRVWAPHRQVAFGRRDAREDGYDTARAIADRRGYPPIERRVGGRAVAYTGTTISFAVVLPTAEPRSGIGARYDAATDGVIRALRTLDVPARRGEPDAAFCPGEHSVQAHGKIAGIAQRVRRDAALVSGIVVTTDDEELAAVLGPVYDALGLPFDPGSVGSVAYGGDTVDPNSVVDTLLDAFCEGLQRDLVDVAALSDDG
jgi:lipoate-protein ligase A